MSMNVNIGSSWQTPLVATNPAINITSGLTEPSNDIQTAYTPVINGDPATARSQEATQTSMQRSQNDEEGNHLLFSCQCDSAGAVGTLLACLRRVLSKSGGGLASSTQATQSTVASKLQHATVYAGPNGLTFHCVQGLAKQSQCSVDLPKGLFREYFVGEEEVWLEESDDESSVTKGDERRSNNGGDGSQKTISAKETIKGGEFGINLTTVLECFSVLSKNHKPKVSNAKSSAAGEYASLNNVPLCMSYDRDTATFHLEFLDEAAGTGGCLVTCEVPGVAVDENGDQSGLASAFRSSSLLGRAILYSDALSAAVGELHDVPGASFVEVKICKRKIELGAVGPRSEVWVTVPYHPKQGLAGMYVGLECYAEENNLVRKYPLSAFLTGMRGLDIGCETCISVNSRGMMAIQHQVAKDDDRNESRPSFVDFIMTCMEEEFDDDHDVNEIARKEVWHGIRDVTNDASLEELSARGNFVDKHSRRNPRSQKSEASSQSSNDEQFFDEVSHTDAKTDVGDQNDASENNTRSTATSRILGELEVDEDMMSSHITGTNKRRISALADIRQRRLRQSMNKEPTSDGEFEYQSKSVASANQNNKKQRWTDGESDNKHYTSDHEPVKSLRKQKTHDTPQDTTAHESHSESESNESEQEHSIDSDEDIQKIFFKSSSMRSSGRDSCRSATTDHYSENEQEEPRMMYGDTKLEFTQDGYDSDDS